MKIPWERLRRLEIAVRRKAQLQRAGRLLSVHKGRGMEFDRVRVYTPGDDVRSIDWNVSARMQQAFVKVHHEERQMKVAIVIGGGASMKFGSLESSKLDFAKEVALLTGVVTIEQGDECLLTIPDEGLLSRPTSRIGSWLQILAGETAKLAIGEAAWQRAVRRSTLGVYISDFRREKDCAELRMLSAKAETIAVLVRDPLEIEIPQVGLVNWKDVFSGRVIQVDTSNAAGHRKYKDQEAAWLRQRLHEFKSRGIRSVVARTDEDSVAVVERLVGLHEHSATA